MSYHELVVVVDAPGKCPVAPQALKAAWSVGLPAAPPPGGVPVGRVPVPLPGTWDGGVTPCFLRQASSDVRVALEPLPAEDDVDVVFVLLLELLPQAAIARLAKTTAASKSIRRNGRR